MPTWKHFKLKCFYTPIIQIEKLLAHSEIKTCQYDIISVKKSIEETTCCSLQQQVAQIAIAIFNTSLQIALSNYLTNV